MPVDPRTALTLEKNVLLGRLGTIWGAEYGNTNYGEEGTPVPFINATHAIMTVSHGEQQQADFGTSAPAYDRPVTCIIEIRTPQNLGNHDLRLKQATLEAAFRETPNLVVGTGSDSVLHLRGIEPTELPTAGGFHAVAVRIRYLARYFYGAL